MTCICGIISGGYAYIGGDSAGMDTRNYELMLSNQPKVFKNKGYIFGYTTSFRFGQVLEYGFVPPRWGPDVSIENKSFLRFIAVDFMGKLRATLAEAGCLHKENEMESSGSFLLGCGSRLFLVGDEFQVLEPMHGIAACGCASGIALGALWINQGESDPSVRLTEALGAATVFSAGVRPPFHIVSTNPEFVE